MSEKKQSRIRALYSAARDVRVTGVPTKVTYAMQDGCTMLYWYMIQRPCPVCNSGWHWEMFDIRWFGVDADKWREIYLGSPANHALLAVREIIRDKNVFLEIANRVGIGVVDEVKGK